MKAFAFIATTLCLVVLCVSCGSSQKDDMAAGNTATLGLPAIASLPHSSSVITNDTANGVDYTSAAHQANSGTAVVLDSDGLTPPDVAYSIYQIPERPGETPHTITVNALYYDQVPTEQEEFEGYWVAYGDFSSGDGGVWRFDGPFMQYQARVMLPAGANVVNSSGNIFVAVVLADGSRMKLGNVQVGYDAGEGYEAYRLAAPRGSAIGRCPQIQIDSDGNPQVAYLESKMNFGNLPFKVKIATLVSGEWQLETVSMPFDFQINYCFACGDSGRRALLVLEYSSRDLHLLWDDGSGSFTDVGVIRASYDAECLPALAFVNGTDTAGGERDTALIVYGGNFAYPNADIHFYEYDGVNPPVTAMFANVRQPGQLNLMVVDSLATLSMPEATAYPLLDCVFMNYSASADVWMVPPIASLINIPLEDSDVFYGVVAHPMGGGNIAAGYFNEQEGNINFSYWDGVTWSTTAEQQISCVRPELWLDFDTFSDGTVVFPTHYNGYNLVIYEGMLGSGEFFDSYPQDGVDNNALETSIVVGSDDVAHIVASNPASGRLDYYTYQQGGTCSAPSVVEQGQDGFGISYGPCGVVYTDDALHVFSVDSSHFCILHSENKNGVWVRESEAISPFVRYSYVILNAGYLETTGQLWVAYIDGVDMKVYVSYSDPQVGDDWTWHTYKVVDLIEDPMMSFEDDEVNLGCTYVSYSPISSTYYCFSLSPLGQTPQTYEPICADFNLCEYPQILSYNKIDQSWNLLTSDDGGNRTYLWHRQAPDNWYGPYLIAGRSNPDDSAISAGITYDSTSGLARVVVYERDDVTNNFSISVYGQQTVGDWNFSAPITFFNEDGALIQFDAIGVTADEDGNPFVATVTRPIADPTLTVDFYRYDGLGNWMISDSWDSPLVSIPMEDFMYYPLRMSPNFEYAFVATEMSPASANFGRIWAYYPW